MKIKKFLVLSICFLITVASYSGSDTTRIGQNGHGLKKQADAYDLVKSGDKRPDVNNAALYHLGYISGAFDMLINAGLICRVGSVTRGQVIDVVNDYVRSNPDKLDMQASDLIFSAFTPVFSCKNP